ncbi:MFS sugar transporter, partial [Halomonas sp. SIMBA_159]
FNTAIMNIGMMLGSSMGGVIIQYTKITYLSWIGGIASLVALMLICYSFYLHQRLQRKTQENQ